MAGGRRSLRLRRLALIEVFGGKCVRCSFSDWRGLQFDHKDGSGEKKRTHLRFIGKDYLLYIEQHKEEFQLLCANCNQIKRYENLEGVTLPCHEVVEHLVLSMC